MSYLFFLLFLNSFAMNPRPLGYEPFYMGMQRGGRRFEDIPRYADQEITLCYKRSYLFFSLPNSPAMNLRPPVMNLRPFELWRSGQF